MQTFRGKIQKPLGSKLKTRLQRHVWTSYVSRPFHAPPTTHLASSTAPNQAGRNVGREGGRKKGREVYIRVKVPI